jgi:hypothetical protein
MEPGGFEPAFPLSPPPPPPRPPRVDGAGRFDRRIWAWTGGMTVGAQPHTENSGNNFSRVETAHFQRERGSLATDNAKAPEQEGMTPTIPTRWVATHIRHASLQNPRARTMASQNRKHSRTSDSASILGMPSGRTPQRHVWSNHMLSNRGSLELF